MNVRHASADSFVFIQLYALEPPPLDFLRTLITVSFGMYSVRLSAKRSRTQPSGHPSATSRCTIGSKRESILYAAFRELFESAALRSGEVSTSGCASAGRDGISTIRATATGRIFMVM